MNVKSFRRELIENIKIVEAVDGRHIKFVINYRTNTLVPFRR